MSKVLVYGLALTGISSVKTLDKLGYEVFTYDKNKEYIKELEGYKYSPISDLKLLDFNYDFVLKSPGIRPDDEVVVKLAKKYQVISDIQASYMLFKDKEKIAITGTNGKTSTTSMTAHILNEAGISAHTVGNIGEGILWQMYNKNGVFVEELSSFQLHDTTDYKAHIAAILNINEDHIDWHKTFKDYIDSKLKLAKNQSDKDFLVINADDKILMNHRDAFKANIYEFSSKAEVKRGLFLRDNFIYLNDKNISNRLVLDVRDLSVIGKHNYENVMAAMLLTYLYGIDIDLISQKIKTFKSIAHRLEYIRTIDGVDFYNDSKGTNVDSSIKAIQSFDRPIIIIAGGYDKHIDYSDFVKSFKKNGKLMILMGQTKYKLRDLCIKEGVAYKLVDNLKEALKIAIHLALFGDVILLSPASASWDMYKSYVDRGNEFRNLVNKIGLEE